MIYQLLFTILFSVVTAWPAAVFERALTLNTSDVDVQSHLEQAYSTLKLSPRQSGFNPAAQYIPTTGQWAFVPPNYAAGDQRGNCPGLNSLANHGFIPRNGIVTTAQMIAANTRIFGMGNEMATFLSTFGSVMHGDLGKVSIGGPTPLVPSLLGLLGTPQGLSGNNSHNKYEGDASATRGDLFLYGDSSRLVMSQFKQLFDMQPNPATANYDIRTIIPFRTTRFVHSVQNNPYFFNAPFAGAVAANAAFFFIPRFMANHSHQYPDGILNQEVLKSFFAISGPRSNFVYTPGWERIPDNWYRRSTPYGLVETTADIVATGLSYPYIVAVGGNTGRINTFTGVNLGSLTGGVFNAATLLQNNNLICFLLQTARFATPDLITGPGLIPNLLSPVVAAVNNLVGTLTGTLNLFSCPNLRTFDKSVFDIFPGRSGI